MNEGRKRDHSHLFYHRDAHLNYHRDCPVTYKLVRALRILRISYLDAEGREVFFIESHRNSRSA